jgi:hypothetical protein
MGTPPPPQAAALQGDWSPFDSEAQFSLADLLYWQAELSSTNIDTLLELWARSLADVDASVLRSVTLRCDLHKLTLVASTGIYKGQFP